MDRWNEAASAFDRGLELVPSDELHRYRAAQVYAAAGDMEGYRGTCRELLNRWGDTDNPQKAEVIAKCCLLLPDALNVADFDRVQKLAERAVTGTDTHSYYRLYVLTKGWADYRAGRYAAAVTWLERFAPNADGVHWDATALALLAMAQHRLGRAEEAGTALANAKAIVAQKMRVGARDWNYWLNARIPCREADELLKEKSGVKNQQSGKKRT